MSDITTTQAYMDGYMMAISRKKEDKNNHTGAEERDAWNRGYKRGLATIEFHTTAIRNSTRASAHWLLNET